jgi:hypothetical protein
MKFLDESLVFVHHRLLLSLGNDFSVDRLDEPMILAFQRLTEHDEGDIIPRPQQLVEQTARTILRRLGAENLSDVTRTKYIGRQTDRSSLLAKR